LSDNKSCKSIANVDWNAQNSEFNIYRLKHGRLFVASWHLTASIRISRYPRNVHAELTGMKLLCLLSPWWRWLHRAASHNLFPAECIHVYQWRKFNKRWWTFIHNQIEMSNESFDIKYVKSALAFDIAIFMKTSQKFNFQPLHCASNKFLEAVLANVWLCRSNL
jgi:hypothetical protein